MAALIWSACSKSEIPKGGIEDPVFSMVIQPDSGDSAAFIAGQKGIYLFTNVEYGADKVLAMSGAFADASCPSGDCAGSVGFEFRNINSEDFSEPSLIFGPGFLWLFKNPELDPPFFRTVAIQWIQPGGKMLRSDIIQQPNFQDSSYFHVLSSEPWDLNEKGETTWKMNVEFSCWMFDSVLTKEQRIYGSGVIAVGYQ